MFIIYDTFTQEPIIRAKSLKELNKVLDKLMDYGVDYYIVMDIPPAAYEPDDFSGEFQ